MPTSVLLAVLAAAGLLALAPALVRRYDATERLVAERAQSTARVLQRRRRRRTVPGRRPLHPPRSLVVTLSEDSDTGSLARPVSAPPLRRRSGRLRPVSAVPAQSRRRNSPRRRHTPAIYRRRRVLAALLLLNTLPTAIVTWGVSSSWQPVVEGVVLAVALAVNSVRSAP